MPRSELKLVSAVYHNRLKKKMKLENPATVAYGLDKIVDDLTDKAITGCSTLSKELLSELEGKDKSASAAIVGKAIAEAIEVNAAERDLSTVIEQLSIVPEVLPDVSEGQALIFDYAPGWGTAVMLDGETIANIEGDEFASGLFSLWLGVPANEELKEGLLGGQCEQ